MLSIAADLLVAFYRFWHGTLHLPGAGALLRFAAQRIAPLQNYRVTVPGIGTLPLDFRMDYAYACTNFLLLQEAHPEEGLVTALTAHASPHMVFWDVGANIGVITENLIRTCPNATFCLFEPNPDLTKRLTSLFSAMSNVTVSGVALSDKTARARFNIIPADSSLSTLCATDDDRAVGLEVELQTGDDFLAAHPGCAPSLIKIDVQGHEVEVISGCTNLIATHGPVIVFEHLFLNDDQLKALVPRRYELFYLDDQTGALSPVLDRHKSHNAILLPTGKTFA